MSIWTDTIFASMTHERQVAVYHLLTSLYGLHSLRPSRKCRGLTNQCLNNHQPIKIRILIILCNVTLKSFSIRYPIYEPATWSLKGAVIAGRTEGSRRPWWSPGEPDWRYYRDNGAIRLHIVDAYLQYPCIEFMGEGLYKLCMSVAGGGPWGFKWKGGVDGVLKKFGLVK